MFCGTNFKTICIIIAIRQYDCTLFQIGHYTRFHLNTHGGIIKGFFTFDDVLYALVWDGNVLHTPPCISFSSPIILPASSFSDFTSYGSDWFTNIVFDHYTNACKFDGLLQKLNTLDSGLSDIPRASPLFATPLYLYKDHRKISLLNYPTTLVQLLSSGKAPGDISSFVKVPSNTDFSFFDANSRFGGFIRCYKCSKDLSPGATMSVCPHCWKKTYCDDYCRNKHYDESHKDKCEPITLESSCSLEISLTSSPLRITYSSSISSASLMSSLLSQCNVLFSIKYNVLFSI